MDDLETSTAQYELRADGIVVQRVKPNARQELKEAQENMAVYFRVAAGQKRCLLVDLRESGPTGTGVREYYAQQSIHLTACALGADPILT
jgi:hypothetical protein